MALHCVGFAFLLADLTCRELGTADSSAAWCEVARPILWSAQDTRKTKEQIDSHNAKWKALCAPKK